MESGDQNMGYYLRLLYNPIRYFRHDHTKTLSDTKDFAKNLNLNVPTPVSQLKQTNTSTSQEKEKLQVHFQ